MKLSDIKNLDATTLTKELTKLGIKKSKLSLAISAGFLPETGAFNDYAVEGEGNFKHVKIYSTGGGAISLSRLQIQGLEEHETVDKPTKKGEQTEFIKISAKDNLYLKGNFTPNIEIQGNQATALLKLLGQKFEAEEIKVQNMKFPADGKPLANGDHAKIEMQSVKTYKLTFLGEAVD